MDSHQMEAAGIIISPSTDKKIKARNAAIRLKHGVPQFKDVLRKRFLLRIKENRGRLFDRLRVVNPSPQEGILQVIRGEVTKIINDSEFTMVGPDDEDRLQEEIALEAMEQENWLMQQYDILMSDDNTIQQLWEDFQQVICPVCKKGTLALYSVTQEIHCSQCIMVVPARASLNQIEDQIYAIVHNHSETGCRGETLFFVSQADLSLYSHCALCPFFDLVL